MNQQAHECIVWLSTRLEANRVVDTDRNWLWTGAKTKGGYGALRIGTRVEYVHRLSASIHLGLDLTSGAHVLHTCDVRCCFNPDHLFPGTHADNMLDAARKGRLGRGKLNPEKVRAIRRLIAEGWTYARIAEQFDVSTSLIGQIARGRVWRHVENVREDGLAA